ncbi:MAG: DUF4157 domain-containing protein [Minicystis sp.]
MPHTLSSLRAPRSPLQRAPLPTPDDAGSIASWADRLRAMRAEPLGQSLRVALEGRFGCDLSDVRVVVDPLAPASGAAACAVGDTIWFAPGAWDPGTRAGQRLLVHEVSHVLQQRAGTAVSPGAGVALLDDPALEAEANRVAAGDPVPDALRRPRRPAPSPTAQLQKWGYLGQEIIASGADTAGAGDNSDWNGAKGGLGKPEDAKPVEFNSTATLNEIRQTRAEAWTRALEIARSLTGRFILVPVNVFYIASDATQAIPLVRQGEIVSLTRHALVGSSGRVWGRYKNGHAPDAAGQGLYYDFGGPVVGGNLLVVEHLADAEAQLKVNANTAGTGVWAQKATVKHFHVAFYAGGYDGYLPINENGNNETYGFCKIVETTPLTQRRSYDIKFVPAHHIYYLDP